MSIESTSITGNNIISLRNIEARDINIGTASNPKIKKVKEEIRNLIAELAQSISILANEKEFVDVKDVKEAFDGIDFDELILSIKNRMCVLFIGPEIAIDKNNNSLHEQFYKRISNDRRKYNETEGLFMPGSEGRIKVRAMEYYNGTAEESFYSQNTIGNNLLKKIAQIPFSLIVSLSPDESIHRIFDKYKIEHRFLCYDGVKFIGEDETLKDPIVYNALGNAAKNGNYIYTHKQLNEYIKKQPDVKFPPEIESKINDSTHLLFLGLNFNRWHYRLLLFDLNLLPKRDEHTGFAFRSKPIIPQHETFVNEQFKIDFINTNFQNFINKLLFFSKEKNLIKPLDKVFVENSLKELEAIRLKTEDTQLMVELADIKSQLDKMKDKLVQFKER